MSINILLVGSGGREHAFAWKLIQSKLCNSLFIAPGNAGTAQCGTNLPIAVNDYKALAAACFKHDISMILVGPEEPLVNGIYDYFYNNPATQHIRVIGPSRAAAMLEGSKAFAKEFMQRHGIPTAGYREFTFEDFEKGVSHIKEHALPIVLKADGLASGKGVIICSNHLEALSEYELMIHRSKFGEAGKKVVVEDFLVGIELSVFVLTDGKDYVLLPEAKDYKRINEGDTGLNTGGMGAVSPVPFADAVFMEKVRERIIGPTIRGLALEGMDYRGFVFFGLMNVNGEPFLIEYNCRMGDPETEVVIPRLRNDLVELLLATSQQRLNEISIQFDERAMAAVVAVSGGYPGIYETGEVILGLEQGALEGSIIFQSGTRQEGNDILTSGGRVLVVSSYGENITEAVEQSNYMLEQLFFKNMYFRHDIGFEFP